MADIDELDRIWRDGLSSAAAAMEPIADPTARVVMRLRRRRRARMMRTALSVAAVGTVVVGAVSLARDPQRADVATSNPRERVAVVSGPDLRIHFPGRAVSGQPPRVELPHGLIRFDVRSEGGAHHLVIDGAPDFSVDVTMPAPETRTVTVRLAPGRYRLHCTIPGHTEAGEDAILIVR